MKILSRKAAKQTCGSRTTAIEKAKISWTRWRSIS